MQFKVGDNVYWSSQAQGRTKEKVGHVFAVVPPLVDPQTLIPPEMNKLKLPGFPRKHESYLIRVKKSINLYWPVVKNLRFNMEK